MKRIVSLFIGALCMLVLVAASGAPPPTKAKKKAEVVKYGICPKTKMVGLVKDCLQCHVRGSGAVKETSPDATRDYPVFRMHVDGNVGYLVITEINSDSVFSFFRYLTHHSIDHAILELHSPGGSLLDAWRVVGLMQDWQSRKPGRIVETRIYGFAASAGFLITISGTMGHRYASPTAELMWHELWTFSMFKLSTPSSSEEEAKTLRHLQNTADSWITSRCKLSKEELDQMVKNKEFWCNGKQAYEKYGFVDGLLGAVK